MMSKFKVYAVFALVLCSLCSVIYLQHNSITSIREDNSRLRDNVETLIDEKENFLIRDSILVSECNALRLSVDELEDYRSKDANLIKDLRMRLKDVRTITSQSSTYTDTVYLAYDIPTYANDDSTLAYSDTWVNFVYNTTDNSLSYTVKDSTTTVLHIKYQKKFLWWRWKPKYKITTINHNPNCTQINVTAIVRDD